MFKKIVHIVALIQGPRVVELADQLGAELTERIDFLLDLIVLRLVGDAGLAAVNGLADDRRPLLVFEALVFLREKICGLLELIRIRRWGDWISYDFGLFWVNQYNLNVLLLGLKRLNMRRPLVHGQVNQHMDQDREDNCVI